MLTATLLDANSTTQDKVLVRLYGSNISSRILEDVYINCYLGALGRIPKIRGLFEGGRFEEFLPCTVISREQFSSRYKDMVQLITEVHSYEMPLPREPCLERLLTDTLSGVSVDKEKWQGEVEWYVGVLEVLGRDMRVTFCHNDFNMNNILVPLSSPSSSTLIDYEYSGYNYSLYDLANYCTEMQYDWSHDQPPYFQFNSEWFPGDTKMLDMIRHYRTVSQASSQETPPDQIMLQQLKFLVLGSELFWSLWALSYEGFTLDMQDYLAVKSESYFTKKRDFQVDVEQLLHYYRN